MKWDNEAESKALKLKSEGKSYREIAMILGTTSSSIKHKIRRLSQCQNMDKYKHTSEKTEQLEEFIELLAGRELNILETNCGFGGMTEQYSKLGDVECYDIAKDRASLVNLQHENVTAIHADSEKEVYRLVWANCKYDLVDIDPYGFPSKYFPHAFKLIEDGLMFLTFPVMGVAQINKIMIRHYQAFWGIELSDKDIYIEKISKRLHEFAFQHKRKIKIMQVKRIDRIYRIAIYVKKKSLCDIVGLTVNRNIDI